MNLLTMARVNADLAKDSFVFTATDGGYGKKTPIDEYRLQGRGGIGIKAAKIDESSRGSLSWRIGCHVMTMRCLRLPRLAAVMRTPAAEVRQTGTRHAWVCAWLI
jgi:DNA gyrase subunit A